jgi:biopolymer transport protein ExbD
MKLRSPLRRRRTRLEIIPLIDIMFFLLASFMMVSLQMQKVRTLKANLPTATVASSTAKPDMIMLNVDAVGNVTVDHKPITFPELFALLTNRYTLNTNLPIYITGDRDTTHGSMMYVLDFARRAGIQRVAIAVKTSSGTAGTENPAVQGIALKEETRARPAGAPGVTALRHNEEAGPMH